MTRAAPPPSIGRRPRARGRGWVVGVDAGGTWVRVEAHGDGGRRVVRAARAAGPDGLPGRLRRLLREARVLHVRSMVVASRGVWTARERRAAARRLAPLAARVRVISDVEAAYLGALGHGPGILLLAGTGAIALGRGAGGRWARAGGLGPLLGDEGSAFWIGRQWLAGRARRDGATRRLRETVTAPDAVARIAAAAPGVLARARRGDPAARAIVRGAQAALAGLALDLARRLRLARPARLSWAGGLMADGGFRAGVWRAMRRGGVPVAPAPPRDRPVTAAARLAGGLERPVSSRDWLPARPTTGRRRAP